MARAAGEFVTATFDHDGGRQVTAYLPAVRPEAVVYAGDGQGIAPWGALLDGADAPPTAVVGVHGLTDDTERLREYSPGFDPERFAAHERFFVGEVRRWAERELDLTMPAQRTAVLGASASGELALAIGLRHPHVYGTILCCSPGGGYRPPTPLPSALPRTYLVAGTGEPFFLDNARRWAAALRAADADVVMAERDGAHGDPFWRLELASMVAWAFAGRPPA